jgi:hypothetical protein
VIFPNTSQSPAVSEIDVTFATVPVVKETALASGITELIYSPTIPDEALSLVVVPTIPLVVGKNSILSNLQGVEKVVKAGSSAKDGGTIGDKPLREIVPVPSI